MAQTYVIYVNQIITRSYEVEVTEAQIMEACKGERTREDGLGVVEFVGTLGDDYSGELVLSRLVGDADPVDDSETWEVTEVDEEDEDE